jgi:16S rRNA processing protein RimM
VLTEDGEELGRVVDIFRVGGSEVYVVRGDRGETLVPAVAMVVKEIDTQAKRIVVDAQALGLRGELADDENPDN